MLNLLIHATPEARMVPFEFGHQGLLLGVPPGLGTCPDVMSEGLMVRRGVGAALVYSPPLKALESFPTFRAYWGPVLTQDVTTFCHRECFSMAGSKKSFVRWFNPAEAGVSHFAAILVSCGTYGTGGNVP